ncbi:hypothetical protein FisN_25Hh132 [Fistulifera solaris]|uniref:Uncharacterized protein n=1 Tax=Fistulifera solaris TaxID=1519565 RepID=A0A1Z5JW48_FISSO|nr:hypothetical protein FisN_25Hh132 [Fistulifera solaris]|eukprot:GAX18149.1 hypothetical protein FisN_25Hh132 [Fistulifera solaris]
MRDYNKIQFRSPSSRIPTGGKAVTSTTTATPSPSKIPAFRSSVSAEKKRLISKPAEQESPKNENEPPREPSNGFYRSVGSAHSNTGSTSTVTTAATTTASPGTRSPSPPPDNGYLSSYLPDTIHEERDMNDSASNREVESKGSSSTKTLASHRESPEVTISRLRKTIEELSEKENASKEALAKSDAVILELRSSVRQLKRQVEKTNGDAMSQGSDLGHQRGMLADFQVELDKAHAQLLTADMVRKELEDTLEAEQYTWELRVQDQERTIQQLQQECSVLMEDLEQTRAQWKEAEEGWSKEVQELQSRLENMQRELASRQPSARITTAAHETEIAKLNDRIAMMEAERNDLQGCLDEALKELEAVDAELQGEGGVSQLRHENDMLQEELRKVMEGQIGPIVEPLQHMYRWLLERNEVEQGTHHSNPNDARQLVEAIQTHLEQHYSSNTGRNGQDLNETKKQVAALESELSVYRGDLKAREESSAELRASLKEAVSLLKPLQDAVAKAEQEKAKMQEKVDLFKDDSQQSKDQAVKLKVLLNEKEDEITRLQEQLESLELQLSRTKVAVASQFASPRNAFETSPKNSQGRSREELRAKREELLKDTKSRFSSLQKRQVESGLQLMSSGSKNEELQDELQSKKAQIVELDSECKTLREELARKDEKIVTLEKELSQALDEAQAVNQAIEQAEKHRHDLQNKLAATQEQLHVKKEVEKALNRSLKEALKLLKPLQMHLEEAEAEKRELAKEMRLMRQRFGDVGSLRSPGSSSASNAFQDSGKVRELQETVKFLELENSQLHNALEDMSQMNGSQVSGVSGAHRGVNLASQQKRDQRLHEQLVEMKSRYDVTKDQLDNAMAENQALIETLKKRDRGEHALKEEIQQLRDQLRKTGYELENAKFIASSALVKVDELTKGSSVQTNRDYLLKMKAREVEMEMSKAHKQRFSSHYSGSV